MAIGPHWPDPAKKIFQFPHGRGPTLPSAKPSVQLIFSLKISKNAWEMIVGLTLGCFDSAGVRPDISQRVLGHVIPGVEGVSDRHSYDHEKALERLAALVASIISPPEGNVVPGPWTVTPSALT